MHPLFSRLAKAFSQVYARPRSWIISILTAGVVFIFIITSYQFSSYFAHFDPDHYWILFTGTIQSVYLHTTIITLCISLLTGIVIALLVHQIAHLKQMHLAHAASSGGIILGVLAPACSSCGIGLVAVLGFSGFLANLPLHGLEVSILSLALLVWAILLLAKKITTMTCTTPRNSSGKNF